MVSCEPCEALILTVTRNMDTLMQVHRDYQLLVILRIAVLAECQCEAVNHSVSSFFRDLSSSDESLPIRTWNCVLPGQ